MSDTCLKVFLPLAVGCTLQVVAVVEALCSHGLRPAEYACFAQLLLSHAEKWQERPGWLAWILPHLIHALLHSQHLMPTRAWSSAVSLCKQQSPSAAMELVQRALGCHPWSLDLWQLYLSLSEALPSGASWTMMIGLACI